MSNYYCPICQKEYDNKPDICDCGFDYIEFPFFDNQKLNSEYNKNVDFKIFKYAKGVLAGRISYEESKIESIEQESSAHISDVFETRGLSVINNCNGLPTTALDGILCGRINVKALILNCDEAKSYFLDESHVSTLLLGRNFKRFTHNFFFAPSSLRYLSVHDDNACFSSENNVLFNKDKTALICYSPARPEEEYKVPASVKSIGEYAFYYPKHLKKLFLPRGIRISEKAIITHNNEKIELSYY